MWWLRPIPRARWALAVCLVSVAFVADVRGPVTTAYPFAAAAAVAGTSADALIIEWRDLPVGALAGGEVAGRLRIDVPAGTPLVPSLFEHGAPIPTGWWTVELPLAAHATPGTDVRVVVLDPPLALVGTVVVAPNSDMLSGRLTGPVALPPEHADTVARAAARDGVVTMIAGASVDRND